MHGRLTTKISCYLETIFTSNSDDADRGRQHNIYDLIIKEMAWRGRKQTPVPQASMTLPYTY